MIDLVSASTAHGEVLAEIHTRSDPEPWSAGFMTEILAKPGVLGLVAQENGSPLGFVLARRAADEAEILTIATLPAARRRGIAKSLIIAISKQYLESGVYTLHLEVAEDNVPARGLYGGLGFEPVGRRALYYVRHGGAVDALLLGLNLVEGAAKTR